MNKKNKSKTPFPNYSLSEVIKGAAEYLNGLDVFDLQFFAPLRFENEKDAKLRFVGISYELTNLGYNFSVHDLDGDLELVFKGELFENKEYYPF